MKIDSSLAAVVTGGASGLGLATVQALRAAGAKVAIFDLNPETGEKAAAEAGATFCQCDVLSDESVDAAFAKALVAHMRPMPRYFQVLLRVKYKGGVPTETSYLLHREIRRRS